MELSEFDKAYFAEWVQEDTENMITINNSNSYKDNEIESIITQFSSEKKLSAKMKALIREDMHPKYRSDLWEVACARKSSSHQLYEDTINELGIQIPNNLPDNIFNREQTKPLFYLLNPEGRKLCLDILYAISQVFPEIIFCPQLQPVTALCLHFMDKEKAFLVINEMLNSSLFYFDNGQSGLALAAKTFQDSMKMFMRKHYKHFKVLIASSRDLPQLSKGAIFFPDWISMIFSHLDFWSLVYIMDNFIVQGPKVLVRVGLVLFSQFDKWLIKNQVTNLKDLEEKFKQFSKDLPLRGYNLMEAAFKIRGLSRKKLESLKAQNLELLRNGVLEIPSYEDIVKIPTLLKLQGTDILSEQQWETLSFWLPQRLQIKRTHCLFSTQKDGFRIQTLYKKVEDEQETIVLVKTLKSEILGAYCATPWRERIHGKKSLSYFGTGETFVFSLHNECQKFPWSVNDGTTNDFFMAGDNTCLMIGGGGDNAIWIDNELLHGHSGRSKTFDNEPLSSEKDFEIVRIEVLGFKN